MNKLRIAIVVVASVVALAGCTSDETPIVASDQPATATPVVTDVTASLTPASVAEVVTLDDAVASIGMVCSGSDRSKECQWDDITFDLVVPDDWAADAALRTKACDEGYINTNYNIVSDGSTWYFAADYDAENTALAEALSAAGLAASIISYCE